MAAASDLTLFYFPASYYSLKIILALHEKGLPFKEVVVNIHGGEQNTDWYLKVNPKGLVPTLKDGDTIISESEDIINYLDRKYKTGSVLVPKIETTNGQEIANFRKLLHDIPVDVITFGLLANQQFGVQEVRFPKFMRNKFNSKTIERSLSTAIEGLRKQISACKSEEIKKGLQSRMENIQRRKLTVLDEEKVAMALDDLDQVFDQIESRLETSKKDREGSGDIWLFGADINAADISALCLMFRLYVLGLDERYFSAAKRPVVFDFYNRFLKRPSGKEMVAVSASVKYIYIKQMVKSTALVAVKVGLVVGGVALGVWGLREYYNASRGLMRA